mmetsp:Transcript_29060/g.52002  ORF Transcript_29060/g.52002 Transcript_29060/m.52002 type:complete len:91 (-) Transcript_29060:302-574(-)
MASVYSSTPADAPKPSQSFKTFPRTVLKLQGVESEFVRVDRFGNEMRNKQQRVSFIDRVKGESIKTVYIVEAAEYASGTKPTACCKCLLM